MLQHDGRRFRLYPWKAKYENTYGQQKEKWALPSKEWWESSAERQGFEVEFEEVELTEKQQERYEQIRRVDMPEQFRGICMDYILEGDFPEGFIHSLREIEIAEYEKEQGQDLSDREIAEIMQGQEISDHEIRILTLEGSG